MAVRSSLGATYGWRARIGFLCPSLGIEHIPYEFYRIVPEGVTICATSLGVRARSQEEYDGAVARIGSALEELVSRKVDAIVQAGVPPVVTHGWGTQDALMAAVARITSIPFATDIMCCVEALQTLQMQRVVMVTSFDDEMHDHLTRFVAHAGVEVVAVRSVGTPYYKDVATLPLAMVYRAGKELYRSVDRADGVWITAGMLPSVGAIAPLEEDLHVPVVTSMQSMVWKGLRLANVDAEVSGYGRLFSV